MFGNHKSLTNSRFMGTMTSSMELLGLLEAPKEGSIFSLGSCHWMLKYKEMVTM